MARKKKAIKPKTYVRLRQKALSGGSSSLYLDIYKDGARSYEFLKLYLTPETDNEAKEKNQNILAKAEEIRLLREKDVLSGEIPSLKFNSAKANLSIVDWLGYYLEQKKKAGMQAETLRHIKGAIRFIQMYIDSQSPRYGKKGPSIRKITKEFCQGYNDFLVNAKKARGADENGNTKPISKYSADHYYTTLSCSLNYAVKAEIIPTNPAAHIMDRVKAPRVSPREYLTPEEVTAFEKADTWHDTIKRAYLFSCFCGLRKSDILKLTWGDIEKEGDSYRVKMMIQKTKTPTYNFLSAKAVSFLPDRGNARDSDKVFSGMPSTSTIQLELRRIAVNAGIKKTVTFHTARHTFATMLISAGVDIYTTSGLLNHTNIKTTQIYAEIVDSKKKEGVNKIANLFNKE